jgi:hypothetical protein
MAPHDYTGTDNNGNGNNDTPDLNDHPQMIAHQIEMDIPSAEEARWYKWLSMAEFLLDKDLAKCGEVEDGCSLDGAWVAFKAGYTPVNYVNNLRNKAVSC